jgi:hypothetical protein
LLCAQPVARAETELFDPFHSADARSQFRAEQTRIGSFMGKPSNRRQLLVDGIGGQTA